MPVSYILGPIPFWQFTDNDGKYAAFGKVYTYNWNTRQPKPTYHDPGGLVPWPNPIPLDSVGRVREIFWEDDVAYYLELRDKNNALIWSTDEPYIPGGDGGGTVTTQIEITNLFINGQFLSFPIGKYEPLPTSIVNLADGGWSFKKNGTNPEAFIEFKRYTLDTSTVPASPIYYLNYVSDAPGTSETINDIIFTISDVRSLVNETITVGVNLRSAIAGTYNVAVSLVQYFGTGGSPSPDVVTPLTTFNPTSTATAFSYTFTVPNLTGKTLGTNGDDNIQIHFRMPLNSIANLEIINLYLKRGNAFADYPYVTPDENEAQIKAYKLPLYNEPTDFDTDATVYPEEQAYNVLSLKPTLGVLQEAWLPAVPVGMPFLWLTTTAPDGFIFVKGQELPKAGKYNRLYNVIGNDAGYSTNNIDSTYLNNNKFLSFTTVKGIASPITVGTSPFTVTRQSEGFLSGVTSANDGPVGNLLTITNTANGAFTPPVSTNTGMTLTIISNGSVSTPASWSITAKAANLLTPSTYIRYETTGGLDYFYLIIDGVGTDPVISGTPHPVRLASTDTDVIVAFKLWLAMYGSESSYIETVDASNIVPGQYITVSTVGTNTYALYARIDGYGVAPSGGFAEVVAIDLAATNSANQVANTFFNALERLLFKNFDARGYFPRFWDDGAGVDPNAATRIAKFTDGVTGDKPGTYEAGQIGAHAHTADIGTSAYMYYDEVAGDKETGTGGFTWRSSTTTGIFGGTETRPINFSLALIIKY